MFERHNYCQYPNLIVLGQKRATYFKLVPIIGDDESILDVEFMKEGDLDYKIFKDSKFFEDTIGSWVSKFFEMVGRERNNYFDSVRIFTGFSGDKNYDPSYFFKGAKD